MNSTSPVFTENEVEFEQVIALDQPEYQPIIVLPIDFQTETEGLQRRAAVCVRFQFSDEDRKAIADGADLVITELVFGNPFTPIGLQLCKPEEMPKF